MSEAKLRAILGAVAPDLDIDTELKFVAGDGDELFYRPAQSAPGADAAASPAEVPAGGPAAGATDGAGSPQEAAGEPAPTTPPQAAPAQPAAPQAPPPQPAPAGPSMLQPTAPKPGAGKAPQDMTGDELDKAYSKWLAANADETVQF